MKANQSCVLLAIPLLAIPLLALSCISYAAEEIFRIKLESGSVSYKTEQTNDAAKEMAEATAGQETAEKDTGGQSPPALLPAVFDAQKPDEGYIIGPVQASDGETYSLQVSTLQPEGNADVAIRLVLRKYPQEMVPEPPSRISLLKRQPVVNGLQFVRRGEAFLYQWLNPTLEATDKEERMSDRFAMATGEGSGPAPMTHLRQGDLRQQAALMPDPVAALGSMLVKAQDMAKESRIAEELTTEEELSDIEVVGTSVNDRPEGPELGAVETEVPPPAPPHILLAASEPERLADSSSESEEDYPPAQVMQVESLSALKEKELAAQRLKDRLDALPPRPLTPSCVLRFVAPSDQTTGVLEQGTLPLPTLSLADVGKILGKPDDTADTFPQEGLQDFADASPPTLFHKTKVLYKAAGATGQGQEAGDCDHVVSREEAFKARLLPCDRHSETGRRVFNGRHDPGAPERGTSYGHCVFPEGSAFLSRLCRYCHSMTSSPVPRNAPRPPMNMCA